MEIGLTAETYTFVRSANVRLKKTEGVHIWHAQIVTTHGAGYVVFQEDQKIHIMNLYISFAQPSSVSTTKPDIQNGRDLDNIFWCFWL